MAVALGDPHPGNHLLMDDGRVCFLDFGLLGRALSLAAQWLFEPGFRRLSPGYVRQLIQQGSSPRSPHFAQMRRQALPAASLDMRRIEGLLLSVLGDLRAGADWAAISREYVAGDARSTALGEKETAFWVASPAR